MNKNRQHLPKVPSDGMEWLRIIASSNKIMKECFDTFRNNQVFEDHMQNFAENDSVQQARGTSLMEVRKYLINFLTSNFNNMSAMYNRLLHFAQNEMNSEKLECFKIIRSAWDSIVQDAIDPQVCFFFLVFLGRKKKEPLKKNLYFGLKKKKKGWMHQKDKEMLKKIRNVHFEDEKQLDKEKYMEIEYLTEETSKETEEKSGMQKEPKKQMKRMSQEEFEQLTDRLLMFITGDAGGTDNEVLTSQKGISVMTREDIEELLKRRQKQMTAMGPDVFKIVLDRIRTQAIDGQKLIASLKKSARALGELLLGQDFDIAINREQLVTELMKIIDFEILKERVKNDLIPKFDKCKSIAKKRLEYFGLGGRQELEMERIIEFSRGIDKFEAIDNQWNLCLKKWISDVSNLRQRYPLLSFYTVNDMRFLCERLRSYVQSNKQGSIGAIASKISLIYPDITIAQIQANVASKSNWNWEDKNILEELAKTLETFESVAKSSGKSIKDEKTVKYLLPGQPRLYICQDSQVLSYVVKLYLSQGQIPIASRMLFCDHSTSLEQLECFLIRSVSHSTATIALHCLVLPELLTRPVQQGLIRILPNYMTKSHSLLAVITTDSQCLMAQTLSAYRDTNPPILDQTESKEFYAKVLCTDFDAFRQKKNDAPFVTVYFSQNPCVGKSYVIAQRAKSLNLKDGYFVHVPINTSVVDTDFIVDRLSSAPVTDDLTVFHINISSQAGKDVNTMMFQLLVLRYITKVNGESFSVRKNHAFLVELPTQLSSTHVKTRLSDVFNWFYFFGDRIKDLAIPFSEVIDDLRTAPNTNPPEHAVRNQLALSEKEHFVLKYLDALNKGLLNNSQLTKDWDHTQHSLVDIQRIKQLLVQYSPKAWNSLVQFKSFLQFMYRQLLQVYNFLYIKNEYVPMIDKDRHIIPLHEMIVFSLVQSAQDIACSSHLIYEPTTDIEVKEKEEKEEEAEEASGTEEFFLVQMWKTADPPIVLLNQTPIAKSTQICMSNLITLRQDLEQAQIEHSLSLLSMNLKKNVHPHAVEWTLVQEQHKWDIYNFEEDFQKRQTWCRKMECTTRREKTSRSKCICYCKFVVDLKVQTKPNENNK
ncbi:hypothetical protein RFI_35357 [Reticulomyxa filosa]|uniref:Uncharacterized protein n=1 Tax=Reticulomyxa filosa TaxID=46433 RepID=X6LJF3_RETFI|nr:hypothetical protein RFI_35357 [Reticulomyxa filosa]|eukprot:ETO02078.1 hypothetical protein RFI_35357 [Reticulomyxa filosa]